MISIEPANKVVILKLGGSVIAPHASNELNVYFLAAFCEFIRSQYDKKFIIVVGGGWIARMYQNAARQIMSSQENSQTLDWIGINATRLNASFIQFLLNPISSLFILDHEPRQKESQAFLQSDRKVLLVCGWQPGWSSDYVAASCCGIFGAKKMIVIGDTAFVYDKDPHKYGNAQPFKKIIWSEYQKIIPSQWISGMSLPVDPIAADLSRRLGLVTKTVGPDIESIRNAIDDLPFEGTTISPL